MLQELTLNAKYVKDWGFREAFREFVSNAFDAEKECGGKASVTYHVGARILRVQNTGVRMPREVLLFGTTSKLGNDALIGQFGEGMKLAALAAVRAGHRVIIRNGDEVWEPKIVTSKRFDAEVLAFAIRKTHSAVDRVEVEVYGVEPQQWESARRMFLKLVPPNAAEVSDGGADRLIRDAEYKGRVFVRGVFVQQVDKLEYAYDLTSVRVDRDRMLINSFDLFWAIRSIWAVAANGDETLREAFGDALWAGAKDLQEWSKYQTPMLLDATLKYLRDRFARQYGTRAFPVKTEADAAVVGYLGMLGVVVPEGLHVIMEDDRAFGTVTALRQRLSEEVIDILRPEQMSPSQRAVVEWAVKVVTTALPQWDASRLRVGRFGGPETMGRFAVHDGVTAVTIAARLLADPREFLSTMVHEVAHDTSRTADGEQSHACEVGRIWSLAFAVFSRLAVPEVCDA